MRVVALVLCMLTMHAWSAFAQDGAPETPSVPSDTNPPPADHAAPSIDATKLGVSFDRIRVQLAVKPETKTSGLRIQETIQVIGTAPKIQLWDPETAKLATGPVPWGAPTHKEFIDLYTPLEFKNYPIDINSVAKWLLEHLADKIDKTEKTEKTEKKSSE